jgi:hypothetical protein
LANPSQHLEAVHAGKRKVQQDQAGKRMRVAVGILTFAPEVGKRLFTIPHNVKTNRLRRGLGRELEQFHIVRVVFDHQNVSGRVMLSCRHALP